MFTWIYRKAFANFSREPGNRVQKVLYGASLARSLILLAGTENSANGISWLILVIGSKWKMRRSSFTWKKWPSHFHKGIPQTGFEPAVSSLGGRRFIQLSYWGILCIIVDFLKFNALGNEYAEWFSHRNDRLRCNRNGVKLVASKFVEKTVILGFAFE